MKATQLPELEALAIKALSDDPDSEAALEEWKKAVLALPHPMPRPSVRKHPNFNLLLDLLTTRPPLH
jgi:hypothetical protein